MPVFLSLTRTHEFALSKGIKGTAFLRRADMQTERAGRVYQSQLSTGKILFLLAYRSNAQNWQEWAGKWQGLANGRAHRAAAIPWTSKSQALLYEHSL